MVIVVRYADDLVLGFQHRTDAERFLRDFGIDWPSSVWNYTSGEPPNSIIRVLSAKPQAAWRGET
jgi:hypothetical protein